MKNRTVPFSNIEMFSLFRLVRVWRHLPCRLRFGGLWCISQTNLSLPSQAPCNQIVLLPAYALNWAWSILSNKETGFENKTFLNFAGNISTKPNINCVKLCQQRSHGGTSSLFSALVVGVVVARRRAYTRLCTHARVCTGM